MGVARRAERLLQAGRGSELPGRQLETLDGLRQVLLETEGDLVESRIACVGPPCSAILRGPFAR